MEWKIGDWCQPSGSEDRYLVFLVKAGRVGLVDADGNTRYGRADSYAHLPDCTGWDWLPPPKPKPIEPPEGYRLLADYELVGIGAMRIDGADREPRHWLEGNDSKYFMTVAEYKKEYPGLNILAVCNKIEPQYRPFKDHVEFWQYRDMWIVRLDCFGNRTDGYWRHIGADELGVWSGCDRITYADLFAKYRFVEQVNNDSYDGTIPCGVRL